MRWKWPARPSIAQHNPCVLNPPVGIKKFCAGRADFGSLRPMEQRRQPMRINDFCVIIEEDEGRALSGGRRIIA